MWTEDEDAILSACAGDYTSDEICVVLYELLSSIRTAGSISCRIRRLGHSAALNTPRGNSSAPPLDQIADLKRYSVKLLREAQKSLDKLAPPKINGGASWEADDLFKTLAATMSDVELNEICSMLDLDMSKRDIARRLAELGLEHQGLGYPSGMETFPRAVRRAVDRVLVRRSKRLAAAHGAVPYEATRHEKWKRTVFLNKIKSRMIDEINYIRSEVAATRASNDGVKPAPFSGKKALVLLLSDFHIGRKVWDSSRKEIYNMEIAIERVASIPSRVEQIMTMTGGLNAYDEIVPLLLGDMVDGDGFVFPGQTWVLQADVTEQVRACSSTIWKALAELRAMGPIVRAKCVRGNHGRGGGRHASPEANWDNQLYGELAVRADMNGDEKLSVTNTYGDYNHIEVKGWRGLLRHKGPPHAGTGSALQKWAGWMLMHDPSFVACGHFHNASLKSYNGCRILWNGALTGYDEFSESLGYDARPEQVAFSCHEEKLIESYHIMEFK